MPRRTTLIESIIGEREAKGPFKDLFEFCRRIDLRKVNRRVLESLIRAGARGYVTKTIDPTELVDETLSSFQAEQQLKQTMQLGQHNKAEIDRMAAAIIVQRWLDQQTDGLA